MDDVGVISCFSLDYFSNKCQRRGVQMRRAHNGRFFPVTLYQAVRSWQGCVSCALVYVVERLPMWLVEFKNRDTTKL